MRSQNEKRLQQIQYWWEGGFPGTFFDDDPLEGRLLHAFRTVLVAMPLGDFVRFLEASPTIVCPGGARAMVFRYRVPTSMDGESVSVNVMYFNPESMRRSTERSLVNTVAHETAHLVLGHQDRRDGKNVDAEAAADALAVSWGFQPCYSARRLAKMRDLGEAPSKTARDGRRGKGNSKARESAPCRSVGLVRLCRS